MTEAAGSEAQVLEWASVPRWPAPELPAAASYLACCFGDAAGGQAQALLAAADPSVPVRMASFADRWDAAAEAELRRLIEASFTGVRIILAGPESIVMRAMAVARQLGANADELVPVATEAAEAAEASKATEAIHGGYLSGTAGRRVFCAGCRRSFDAVAAIGDLVTCQDCAAELIVDQRFSRPHAAYYGWPSGLDLHR